MSLLVIGSTILRFKLNRNEVMEVDGINSLQTSDYVRASSKIESEGNAGGNQKKSVLV